MILATGSLRSLVPEWVFALLLVCWAGMESKSVNWIQIFQVKEMNQANRQPGKGKPVA
jgi:hypothetical protein